MIFIKEFSNNTGSSFNMQSGRQDRNVKKTIVHGVRKCIMNVRHDNNRKFLRSGLQRACPSKISFRLEETPKKLVEDRPGVRAKKELVGDFPLHFSRFDQFFEEDMTASAAWHRHREEITMANPDTYHLLLGLLSFQIVLLRTGIKRGSAIKSESYPQKRQKVCQGQGFSYPKELYQTPF